MKENMYIGSYWSARKESRHECASKIAQFLEALAGHGMGRRWFLPAGHRSKAMTELALSVAAIAQSLRDYKGDFDDARIPELGYNFSIWNGNTENPLGLSFSCGSYSERVENAVVLNLGEQIPPQDDQQFIRFRAILQSAIEIWDPDSAVVSSDELRNRADEGGDDPGGYLVYLRGKGITESAAPSTPTPVR